MRRPVTLWLAGALLVLTAVFAASAAAGAGKGHDGHPDGQDAQASQQPQQEQQEQQQAGTKPGNDTSKWTTTHVGAKPDVSKRYGNGTTAAEIAKIRHAPDDTVLTGPGNSQPHKVTACGKPSNRSGGVDVHAVKSYLSADCQSNAQQPAQQQPAQQQPEQQAQQVAPTASSASVQNQQAPAQVAAPVTPAPIVASNAQPAAQSQGQVLGAMTHLSKPNSHARGGVLGAVGNIAGGTLPFTGFPVWLALIVAFCFLGAGLLLRRGGSEPTRT